MSPGLDHKAHHQQYDREPTNEGTQYVYHCVGLQQQQQRSLNVTTTQPDEAEPNLPIVLYEDDRGI